MTSGIAYADYSPRRRSPPIGIDELYGFAAVAICLGSVLGGKAVVFTLAAAAVLAFDFKLVLRYGASLLAPRFAPLYIFLAVHLASGLTVSTSTFLHLVTQVSIVAAFAVPFYCRYQNFPMERFNRAFGMCAIAVVVILIAWHVSNGMLSGWKRYGETKTALSFLPLVMAAFVSARSTNRLTALLATAATCIVILLSGERKAYFCLAVALAVNVNLRNPLTYLAGLGAVAILPIVAQIDPSGYIARQIDSAVALAGGNVEHTLSNDMREWQSQYALQLHDEHPLFGIGTKHYVETMVATYGASKSNIIAPGLTIHGDLLRVLVENGVVGLSAWVFMLLMGAYMVMQTWRPQGRRSSRERKLALLALISMLFFIGFEAFDTTMMILYWVIPMLGRLNIEPALPA
jgi:O-antigen ligase